MIKSDQVKSVIGICVIDMTINSSSVRSGKGYQRNYCHQNDNYRIYLNISRCFLPKSLLKLLFDLYSSHIKCHLNFIHCRSIPVWVHIKFWEIKIYIEAEKVSVKRKRFAYDAVFKLKVVDYANKYQNNSNNFNW